MIPHEVAMTWLTHSIQLFRKHAARILNLKLLSRISMAYRLVTDTFLLSNSMGFQKTRRLWMMNLTWALNQGGFVIGPRVYKLRFGKIEKFFSSKQSESACSKIKILTFKFQRWSDKIRWTELDPKSLMQKSDNSVTNKHKDSSRIKRNYPQSRIKWTEEINYTKEELPCLQGLLRGHNCAVAVPDFSPNSP